MNNLQRFADFETGYSGMLYPAETDHMLHANVRYYSRAFNETAWRRSRNITITAGSSVPATM